MEQCDINGNIQKQFIITDRCTNCGSCKRNCNVKAIDKIDKKLVIEQSKCVKCGDCYKNCPLKAIIYV